MALRAILNDAQAVLLGERADRIHIRAEAIEMHRDHRSDAAAF